MRFTRLAPLVATSLLLSACATTGEIARPAGTEAAAAALQAPTGLVSAADPRAADAGAQMLRQGGSSTDAAIATMLALTVVEPQSSGIGGGGFFVRGTADGQVSTIDGRETAPAAAGPDWFLAEDGTAKSYGDVVMTGLSTGVPGNIRLAEQAHRQYGRLAWASLFAPAIKLAEDGFAVSPRFNEFLVKYQPRAAASAEGRALFYTDAGDAKPVGTIIRNPDLAATLKRIAAGGPDWFYTSEAGAEIAARIRRATPRDVGMTAQDLASYEAKPRDAVCGEYRAYRICGMGPPSSGATTVIAILKQLEPFDLNGLGVNSPVSWHVFAESQRLAYADRERYLADPDFITVPVQWLLQPDYLAGRARLISTSATMQKVEAGVAPALAIAPPDGTEPPENGTSHFVALDREGTAVSYTSTIEGPFGSGLMMGGFYLNNELTDFSLAPVVDGQLVANRVESGKRPRSSMAPTVVYAPDGQLIYILGAAGGGTIPVQVAKTLIGLIDFRLPLADALALPQLYSPGDTVVIEQGSMLESMTAALTALGHSQIMARELPLKTNAAERTATGWVGAADPRSEGASVPQ